MGKDAVLQEAVRRLGFYVGEIGQHQFMARLLNVAAVDGGGVPEPTAGLAAYDALTQEVSIKPDGEDGPGRFAKVIDGLLGTNAGGTLMHTFVQDCQSFVENDEGEDDVAGRINSDTKRLFTVTFVEATDSKFVNGVTITELLDETYNTAPEAPTKETPNISIMQFHDVALNFANRDAGVVGTFMNMVPTIEMSKCQPFVDVKIITTIDPIDASGNLGDGISIFKFLKGKASAMEGGEMNLLGQMASAKPQGMEPTLVLKKNEDGTTAYDENGQPDYEETKVTVAGMEVFTSPQTMVDGDNFHTDLGPPGTVDQLRATPTIDRFRPFMTFKSLNLKVAPTRGMMSTKTGDINFILHDRSRLHEISSFVRPSGLGEIELMVTYGWTHPEYNQGTNPIADLLGSMSQTQKYGVQNSTLSFNDVGEVNIKCKIYTKGSYETTNWLITSAEISDQMAVVQSLLKAIRELKRKLRADLGDNEEMVGQDVLGKANSAQAIMGLSREDRAELATLVRSLKRNEGDYKELGEKLGSLTGTAVSFGNMIDTWFTTITDGLDKKPDPFIKSQEKNGIRQTGEDTDTDPIRGKDHVSFARVCLDMIAAPLAATNKFDEVQIMFYPFNAQSSWCYDLDIGSFPINKANFKKLMKEEFKKRPAMTIAAFIGRMNSVFFGNLACDAYGFADLYDRDPETGKAKLAKAYERNQTEKAKVSSEKKKVLETAYSTGATYTFKRPQVQMQIECVPGKPNEPGGEALSILRLHFFDKAATSYSGFSQMWDSLRSSLSSGINRAAIAENQAFEEAKDATGPANQGSNHGESWGRNWEVIEGMDPAIIEIVNSENVADWIDFEPVPDNAGNEPIEEEVDAAKATLEKPYVRINGGPAGLRYLLTRNMPSIKYGTSTSAVIAASLATNSDSKMATIHMTSQKEAKSSPGQDDGLPLRTFPSTLSLECYGCPLINFGQQFFVDFGTGTSLDDVYAVTGIDHSLSPGEFKTKLKMTPLMKFGQFQSMTQNISKMMASASDLAATKEEQED